MAGPNKKRTNDNRTQRPAKKQKRSKQKQYHSGSEEEEADDFDPVNLLDSDDDIHNATIEDAPSDDGAASSSGEEQNLKKPAPKAKGKMALKSKKSPSPTEQPVEESDEEDSEGSEDDDEDDQRQMGKKKNDNTAFATSLTKILGTKLSTSKRSDPVLSRSIEAQEASRQMADNALESKAKKQLRDQKRRAFEKGRVKDVLVATSDEKTGEFESSTAEIMETERRLRKTAQRGVVKLFNAVRAAQVAGTEAEKGTKKAGVIGMGRREEKVNELSKKGFLDLIASGGGGLKKGGIEEA